MRPPRNTPSGWWILPAIIAGMAFWLVIIFATFTLASWVWRILTEALSQ
jgi:hypothetical protein